MKLNRHFGTGMFVGAVIGMVTASFLVYWAIAHESNTDFDEELLKKTPPSGMTDAKVPPSPSNNTPQTKAAEEKAADNKEEMVYWQFDEGTGKEISDSTNNPKYRGIYCGEVAWTAGKIGSALNLDGKADYVALQDPEFINIKNQYSVAVWVKRSGSKTNLQTIIAQENLKPGANSELFLRVDGNQYQFGLWFTAVNVVVYDIPEEDHGKWVHLAGVYDGKCWKLFHNGELVAARKYSVKNQGSLKVIGPWSIGGSRYIGEGRNFEGLIDDLRVYNRGLTEEEILALAEPTVEPKKENPPPIEKQGK